MTAIRIDHSAYGKARVRLMKVDRAATPPAVYEFDVDIEVEGDFDETYTEGDNRRVLPTDTMKNTVYMMAATHTFDSPEQFALLLCGRFMEHAMAPISAARVTVHQHLWKPLTPGAVQGPESFAADPACTRYAYAERTASGARVCGGVRNLRLLKTNRSAFVDYIRDEWTSLTESRDRLFMTVVEATFEYKEPPVYPASAFDRIWKALVSTFAVHDSLSGQQTLYDMGRAALDAAPEIANIEIILPNQHCHKFPVESFGVADRNEVFIATTEPHGRLGARLARGE